MSLSQIDQNNPAFESRELAAPQLETQVSSLAVQIAQAELNQAVTTARAFPRSIDRAVKNIMTLATLDTETATECVYALPRAGKAIRGPSVRFAEIIGSQWGNCHIGSRVVAVDPVDKVVIAEGVFHDLETGFKRIAQVRRRISDKNGKLFNDDMIVVAGNAACAIAMRESVLKGVPKGVWRRAYEACERVIAGDVKTLVQRRDDAVKSLATFGVTPEQIAAYLEVGGVADITIDHLATLSAIYHSIRKGEQAVEDYFDPNAKAALTRKPAAQQSAKPIAKPAPTQAQDVEVVDVAPRPAPEASAGPMPVKWDDFYDQVIEAAKNSGSLDGVMTHYGDHLDLMQKEIPALYQNLMAALDALTSAEALAQANVETVEVDEDGVIVTPEDAARAVHLRAYEAITQDLIDGAPIDTTRQHHAKALAAMKAEAPDLFAQIEREFAEVGE